MPEERDETTLKEVMERIFKDGESIPRTRFGQEITEDMVEDLVVDLVNGRSDTFKDCVLVRVVNGYEGHRDFDLDICDRNGNQIAYYRSEAWLSFKKVQNES